MSHLPVDFVFDYESIGPFPKGKLAELSYVPFVDDPYDPPTFQELIAKGRKYKFDIRKQPERIKDEKRSNGGNNNLKKRKGFVPF